jgi:hypothetical protein
MYFFHLLQQNQKQNKTTQMNSVYEILVYFFPLNFFEVPNIINHARTTKEVGKLFDQPSKLTPKQCLLNFILYFQHDNVTMHDTFMWNSFKTFICDDALFILSCINEAIVDDIQWSILEERVTLTRRIWNLLGCIRFIDITLVEIFKLWNNVMHWTWLNVRKKI